MCARAPSGLRTFLELRLGELRRIPLPRTSVNKGKKRKGPESRCSSPTNGNR
jgi:hypothetical protein